LGSGFRRLDTDITHTGIIIPIVMPIIGPIATMDIITGPTIGTVATVFTIILGITTVTGKSHRP
jgi:hypothetical protein